MAAVLCLAGALPAHTQELDWAKRAGGTDFDEGRAIATDTAGNSCVTGEFFSMATFGVGEPGETTLTAAAASDNFVARYDSSGALVWAKRAGGGSFDRGNGIATDDAGNCYITGLFSGTATFGPGEANQTTITSAGSDDVFVARYDPSGALVWAKRAGGTSVDLGNSIAADDAGNCYVTGAAGASSMDANIFVAKYDASGALVWTRTVGGPSGDIGSGIAADGAGNSYVTGFFNGPATFGAGEPSQTTLTGAGTFIAKYNAIGTLVWAQRAAGNHGRGIATDGTGYSYVTGELAGDIFVAKYDPNGALVWSKRAGGTGGDRGEAIATDGAGNSYVTGLLAGTGTFGAGEVNQTTLTSAGGADIFVAKYDSSGALVWAKRAGASISDLGHGIATDGAGNAYVTGLFQHTVTFGVGEANETTLTAAAQDIFGARFSGVPDADGDGIADGDDNCPDDANANQLDTDEDGDGDACDADDDNDTVVDGGDNCPLDANPDQADADGDGAGNVCDADLDGDGVIDAADACLPTQTGAVVNADGCSIDDLVPCDSPWKNHGAYVSMIVKTAKEFLDLGLITEAEKDAIVAAAGQSQCGQ